MNFFYLKKLGPLSVASTKFFKFLCCLNVAYHLYPVAPVIISLQGLQSYGGARNDVFVAAVNRDTDHCPQKIRSSDRGVKDFETIIAERNKYPASMKCARSDEYHV